MEEYLVKRKKLIIIISLLIAASLGVSLWIGLGGSSEDPIDGRNWIHSQRDLNEFINTGNIVDRKTDL